MRKPLEELPIGTYLLYVPPDVYEVSQTYIEVVDLPYQIIPGVIIMADPHLPKNRGVAWSRNENGKTELTIVHFNEQDETIAAALASAAGEKEREEPQVKGENA